jgi:hypothetical protein
MSSYPTNASLGLGQTPAEANRLLAAQIKRLHAKLKKYKQEERRLTKSLPMLNIKKRGRINVAVSDLGRRRRRMPRKLRRAKLRKFVKKYGKTAAVALLLGPAAAIALKKRAKIKAAFRRRRARRRRRW